MPDFSSAGDLFRSRIMGQGLEDTQYPQQGIQGILSGATPEQLQGFFADPQVQSQFKAFGIDPQALTQHIRQSPYLPQSFMQSHPHLGGALSGAMSAAANTPEAPLVSGAGSGISRAMQGLRGGNNDIRQFQLHQMMAPFGAMAAQMPAYGEQRRRAIEEAIVNETQARQQMLPWQKQMQDQTLDMKRQLLEAQEANQRAQAQWHESQAQMPKTIPGMGLVYPGQGLETSHPPGMPAELGGQVAQGGPKFQPFDQSTIDSYVKEQIALHPERQALADWRQSFIDAGVPDEQANYYAQRAYEAQQKGHEAKSKAEHPGGAGAKGGWTEKGASQIEEKKAAAQNAILKEYAPIKEKYKSDQEWQAKDPNSYNNFMSRMQQLEDQYAEAGRALGGTYPGYTYPGMHSSLPPQNPFMSPGAATPPPQQGAPSGAATGGTTPSTSAPKQGEIPGHPGWVLGEDGIPRETPQQAPPRQ